MGICISKIGNKKVYPIDGIYFPPPSRQELDFIPELDDY